MESSLLSHFKQLRLLTQHITQVVSQVSTYTSMSPQAQIARVQIERLQKDMRAVREFTITPTQYKLPQSDSNLYIQGITTLISAVLTSFKQLDVATASHSRSAQFHLIWKLLVDACWGWAKWADIMNVKNWQQNPAHQALSAALADLMAWLLAATRSHSYGWGSLKAQSEISLIEDLNAILAFPCNILLYVHDSEPVSAETNSGLCLLPHNFVSLLCCLVYEQLGEIPLAASTAARTAAARASSMPARIRNGAIVHQIASILAQVIERQAPASGNMLLNSLSTPAVIELMQLVVVRTCEENRLQKQPPCVISYLVALAQLIGNRERMFDDLRSSNDAASCKDVVTLSTKAESGESSQSNTSYQPPTKQPELAPRSTVSEQRLVSALCNNVSFDQPLSIWHLRLMLSLLGMHNDHREHFNLCIDSCASLAILAHHCSSRTLLWMQSFQTKTQRLRHKLCHKLTALQQDQQQLLNTPAAIMFGKEVLLMVRGVMTNVNTDSLKLVAGHSARSRCGDGLLEV